MKSEGGRGDGETQNNKQRAREEGRNRGREKVMEKAWEGRDKENLLERRMSL